MDWLFILRRPNFSSIVCSFVSWILLIGLCLDAALFLGSADGADVLRPKDGVDELKREGDVDVFDPRDGVDELSLVDAVDVAREICVLKVDVFGVVVVAVAMGVVVVGRNGVDVARGGDKVGRSGVEGGRVGDEMSRDVRVVELIRWGFAPTGHFAIFSSCG